MKQNISFKNNLLNKIKEYKNFYFILQIINAYLFKYFDINLSKLFIRKKTQVTKKVLFATGVGTEVTAMKFETNLSNFLKVNNFSSSDFFICDSSLQACQYFKYNTHFNDDYWLNNDSHLKKKSCSTCYIPAKLALQRLGNIYTIKDFLSLDEHEINKINNTSFEEKKNYIYRNVNVGEQALAGTLRYLCMGTLVENEENHKLLKKYLISAVIYCNAFENFLSKNNYQAVICNHGIYVPHGITVEVCKKLKVQIFVWNLSYRANTFMISKGDTYHRTLLTNNDYLKVNFDESKKLIINNYLNSRINGKDDWLSFQKTDNKLKNVFQEKNINLSDYNSSFTMVTNVIWDAQIHFKDNIFEKMSDWIVETVNYFIRYPKKILFIRAHPAEMRGVLPSRETVKQILEKNFSKLPNNIIFFDWDDEISSYDCAYNTDVTLIYGTKMGVELSAFGKPVIVVGDAWVKNKGFVYQPKDKREYFSLLDDYKSLKITKDQKEKALKFAYWYFYENSIEVTSLIHKKSLYPPYRLPLFNQVNKLKEDKGLKIFKDIILD